MQAPIDESIDLARDALKRVALESRENAVTDALSHGEKRRLEIAAVLAETHGCGQKLKVIFENCYLTDSHKIRLCEICGELGVDWVKTSTGFGSAGATLEDLRLMRAHSPATVQVKASGGVRELSFVLAAREIGVTRCGSSRTREILDACRLRTS